MLFQITTYVMERMNEWLLQKVASKRVILSTVASRKLRMFGHLIRKEGLEKTKLQGKVQGKRNRGRPRKCWQDDITGWSGRGFQETLTMVK